MESRQPITHGASRAASATTRWAYVVAADVTPWRRTSAAAGGLVHGSAAWMYRLIVESLLGFRLEGERLSIEPCLPADWQGFTVHYRFRETVYHVHVHQTPHATGDQRLNLDGQAQPAMSVPLVDYHVEHRVDVWVRSAE
jgi:cellobiose phosphorylase